MKMAVRAAALSLFAAGAGAVSPIGKVLELIGDLQSKVIAEGEQAQKVYSEFAEWCEDRSKDLAYEIKTGKAEVESLKAAIAKATSSAEALSSKVDELASGIAANEGDLKAATDIRKSESADFAASEKELSETISVLERAIRVLEREMQKGGAAMLQLKNAGTFAQAVQVMVQAAEISSGDAGMLQAFVQQGSDAFDEDAEAPAAAAYESHSGDIIETLQGLLDKAEAQLDDLRKKETSAKHNFEMLEQSLTDEVKYANKELAEAKQGISAEGEAKASAEGDLDTTSKELASDQSAEGQLHQSCLSKSQEFEAEVNSRAEELQALAEAKKVLSEATGAAADTTYSFLQAASSSALASGVDLAGFEAVRLIRDLGRKQHSPELVQLSERMAAVARLGGASKEDAFGKVKALISDMIKKLEARAGEEATKKAYCDKELAETGAKKEDKSGDIERLSTKIDQMSSKSAELKQQVSDLQNELAKLSKAQAEMDQIRRKEHEAYVENEADLQKGLDGVTTALKILNEYYGSADKAHAAAEGAGKSIIGLLEVVESDFAKGLAEVKTGEDMAQAAFEKETQENSIEKTMKDKDVEHKTKESAFLDKSIAELTSDRAGAQAELDAVLEYLVRLQEQCIAKAETYSERKARREAELAGLKEALQILESETALVQRKVLRHRALRGVAHLSP